MLAAAVESKDMDEEWNAQFPKAKEDIVALVKGINAFSDKRNAAVHAPCSVGIGTGELEILPFSFFQNPNARKLHGKNILDEFEWYERTAAAYHHYARELGLALSLQTATWPDKPRMPSRGEKNHPQ